MVMMAVPYREAMTDVRARVAASRTSFHAGMAVLPKERRDAMYALYAFCREVDDIADDSESLEESATGLEVWRQNISAVFRGEPRNSITSALAPAIQSYGLVEEDFQSIIDGMAMDAKIICAPDANTLDLYCDRVASAVGRVSVRIFGDAGPLAMQVSTHLGRAFQLTNILRDLKEDAARGRLYLPEELLQKHHITSRRPDEVLRDPHLRDACRELAKSAGEHFAAADKAMSQCKPSAMRPAKIMRAYYGAIFNELLVQDWRDISHRVRLPFWQKMWLVLRHLAG